MQIPKRVYLRGQHLGLFINKYPDYEFRWELAWGQHKVDYSERTRRDIVDFYRLLTRSLDTEIEVVNVRGEPDSVCLLCNNYDKRGNTCKGVSHKDRDNLDKLKLSRYRLEVGDVLTVREAIERFNLNQPPIAIIHKT